MATYFVRKNGSDAYTTVQAQNAATAWLTIDKAANEVAAGDTVVVGAGVYRELVTMDTAGTSGNQITYIADVDGSNGSGDPGLVIISAYADETSAATRAACIDADATGVFEYTTWRGFTFTGGTTACIDAVGTGNETFEGTVIEDCVFVSGHAATGRSVVADYNDLSSNVSPGLIFRRCTFLGAGMSLLHNGHASTSYDAGVSIDSCRFIGTANVIGINGGVNWELASPNTFNPTMGSVTNCAFFGQYYAIEIDSGAPSDTLVVRNCVFSHCYLAFYAGTSQTPSCIDSDYNVFAQVNSPYFNTDAGSNDDANTSDPGLWGGLGDATLWSYWGWSPFRPWEPIRLQDDAYIHAVVGAGDTATAPAFDLYNEARPMYGTVDDVGAVEGRARPEAETTTKRTGTTAARFEGAGFHDIILPVSDSLTTVDVYAQYDATYSGTLPQLKALNIPGVADQTDTQTGGSGSFEKLTVTFTPTSKGVARIRLQSNDTSAAGECFFDDLAVS